MTWWHNAWWVRVNNGPHLRTARDRRRVWRAATRAAQEVRDTGKVAGEEREKWETGSKESNASNTLHIVFHLPQQQQQQTRPPQQATAAAPAAMRPVPVMPCNEACHRSVDLERPRYYNEAKDGRYLPRAILLDFEPRTTASVRDQRRCHIRGGSRLAWACWLLGAIPDPGYSEAHCTRA